MKNYLLFFIAILCITLCEAQEKDSISSMNLKHELKLDAVELVAAANVELSYEYLISTFSGVGISIAFDAGSNDEDVLKWAITPFYRQYFFNRQSKRARGLFAEGHLNIGSFEDDYYYNYDYYCEDCTYEDPKKTTALGAGFAIGYKWASDNGFVIEPSLGVGRNLFLKDNQSLDVYFRGGVLVGYRF